MDADGERAREGGDAEPEDGVGHRRQIGGVEDPVGAHARVEILVEGLDADDREHHAGEAAEEDRAVECVGQGVGPGRAEQVGKQSRVEEEAVAHQRADADQALPRRAAERWPVGAARDSEIDPLVQGSCLAGVGGEILDEPCDAAGRATRCGTGPRSRRGVSRRKSPQMNGRALMSLTRPLGSTISRAAGCWMR